MIIMERNFQLHFVENYKYFYIFPIIFSCHRNFIFDFLYGQKFSIFFFIQSLYKTYSFFFIHTNLSCFKLSNNACYWDSKFISICLIKWYEIYRIFIHDNIFYMYIVFVHRTDLIALDICTYKKWRRKKLTWKWLKFVYIDIINGLFLP